MPIVFDVIEFVHEHQQQLFVMNHIWIEYLVNEMNVSVDMYLFSMITFDYFNSMKNEKKIGKKIGKFQFPETFIRNTQWEIFPEK